MFRFRVKDATVCAPDEQMTLVNTSHSPLYILLTESLRFVYKTVMAVGRPDSMCEYARSLAAGSSSLTR